MVAIVAAVTMCPQRADACTCGTNQGRSLSIPSDGDVDVPVDALFWSSADEFHPDRSKVFNTATGDEVPGSWSTAFLEIFEVSFFRPAAPWDANSDFDVRAYDIPSEFDELADVPPDTLPTLELYRTRFRTGSGEAPEVGPPTTTYEIVETSEFLDEAPDSCDESSSVRVSVRFKVVHDGALAVVHRDGQAPIYDGAEEYFGGRYYYGTSADGFRLGTRTCDANWYDAEPGAQITLRVGTVDLRGAIRWDNPLVLRLPAGFGDEPSANESPGAQPNQEASGCSSSAGQTPSALPITLAFALWVIARRRHRTT